MFLSSYKSRVANSTDGLFNGKSNRICRNRQAEFATYPKMKQQTTEIYIETRERIVFRQTSAQEIEAVCAACDSASIFIEPERAAFLFNLKTREIYRRIERGNYQTDDRQHKRIFSHRLSERSNFLF